MPNENTIPDITNAIGGYVTEQLLWLIGLLVAAAISFVVARFVILPLIRKLVGKTKFTWDDVIFESNVLRRISLLAPALAPALVGYFGVALIPDLDPAHGSRISSHGRCLIPPSWSSLLSLALFTGLRRLDLGFSYRDSPCG